MTLSSALVTVLIIAGLVAFVFFLAHWRRPPTAGFDKAAFLEQTRAVAHQAAKEAALSAAHDAQSAAVQAYQQQQAELREQDSAKRREAAARAKETRTKRIEALEPWRETFVVFVRRLAEPFFAEWNLDRTLLEEWARERAGVYIAKKPYVLEIIQSVHADAQRAAEAYANRSNKSEREIARDRAKTAAQNLARNVNCPYCGIQLDDRAHLDHVLPVQRGGPSEPWNLVFACMQCNLAKRDLSLAEFVATEYARSRKLSLEDIARRLRDLNKYGEISR